MESSVPTFIFFFKVALCAAGIVRVLSLANALPFAELSSFLEKLNQIIGAEVIPVTKNIPALQQDLGTKFPG